jgi:hypothetical protein
MKNLILVAVIVLQLIVAAYISFNLGKGYAAQFQERVAQYEQILNE